MLLKVKNPRTLFRLAMGCLAIFGLLGMLHPASSSFNEGVVDGARGALLGAAVALIWLTFRLQHRRSDRLM
jgi:hypothetical protein